MLHGYDAEESGRFLGAEDVAKVGVRAERKEARLSRLRSGRVPLGTG